MFEEKESWWKSKGFYFSACVLLVGVMAAGVVFYQKSGKSGADKMLAEIATEVPESSDVAGGSALKEQSAQANANITPVPSSTPAVTKTPEQIAKEQAKKAKALAAKKAEKAKKEAQQQVAQKKKDENAAKAVTAPAAKKYTFNEEKGLLWPVKGDVLMKYSMSKTIYFKTLAQYKYNPGVIIAAKEGTEVKAAASGRVETIKKDDELGQMVVMDIGDDYTVIYGQLKDVSVKKGDDVNEGETIGKIAKPTKYYAEEGSNLFLQVKEGKETVDPLLLLR